MDNDNTKSLKVLKIVKLVLLLLVLIILVGILYKGINNELNMEFGSFKIGINGVMDDDFNVLNDKNINFNADDIKKINIDTVSSNISLISSTEESEEIKLSVANDKYEELDNEDKLIYKLKDGTLSIRSSARKWHIGINFSKERDIKKDIKLVIPKEKIFEKINLDTVSGETIINEISADKLKSDNVNAILRVKGKFKEISADSISGNSFYEVESERINLDTVSGNIDLSVKNPLNMLNIDSVSGNIGFYLPNGIEAKISVESVSGEKSCELNSKIKGDKFLIGNQSAENLSNFSIKTVSGDINIRDIETKN